MSSGKIHFQDQTEQFKGRCMTVYKKKFLLTCVDDLTLEIIEFLHQCIYLRTVLTSETYKNLFRFWSRTEARSDTNKTFE